MKAAVFDEPGKPLVLTTVADPTPGPGEVVLRVSRCGICGTDLHLTEIGGPGQPKGTILGHEVAGEIVALGKGVGRLKIGDRIAALPIKGCGHCAACQAGQAKWCKDVQYVGGGFAQYARAGENEAILLPAGLSMTDGALVEPLSVARCGLRSVSIAGASVVVLGAGPVGLGVIFWAKRLGAARIDVFESNLDRQAMALALGVDAVSQPASTPAYGELVSPRNDAADVAFECVGRPGLLLNAVSKVRPRGTVVSLGVCMAEEPFLARAAMRRELTMIFPAMYTRQDYIDSIEALEKSDLDPRVMVTATVSLSELPDQLEALRRPSHHCKIMVDPWQDK